MSRLLLLGLCLVFTAGASDAARKRVTLAPVPGIYSDADIKEEILFGREMSAIILADRKLVEDINLSRYLNLVGQALVRHSSRPELQYYFAAIESDQINAYAAPGGYIFVTTAALNLMQSEAELAGVLAHEIAHVTQRHIVKTLKIREADNSTIALIGKVVGSSSNTANIVYKQALDHAATTGKRGRAADGAIGKQKRQPHKQADANADGVGRPSF